MFPLVSRELSFSGHDAVARDIASTLHAHEAVASPPPKESSPRSPRVRRLPRVLRFVARLRSKILGFDKIVNLALEINVNDLSLKATNARHLRVNGLERAQAVRKQVPDPWNHLVFGENC